jgi:sugar transferase (PEP-CTERM/EpsH1 system associated)
VRLLYICHRVPYPPNRGGKIRPFQMIQHLAKSHEVTVASLAHDDQELSAAGPLREHCKQVIAEVVPNRTRWTNAVLALPTPLPSSAAYFRSARLARRIQNAWFSSKFDGVMVHCAFAAQYALPLSGGFRIMDFGDLDSAKWSDYAAHRSFPLSTGYALEARKLGKFEKHVAASSTHCTFTTRGELEAFRRFGLAKPVTVIPNGVDTSYFHREVPPPAASKVLAFLGRMDYFPNIDGICWFVREVFPLVRSVVPEAVLRIVGSNPAKPVQDLAALAGIRVTGYVPDVRPHLADAAIAIAPLRLARGTQNKILECMGMGLPVVTTRDAARGIQATPGQHLLVADSPQQQAEFIIQLLSDPSRRASLGEAGRQQAQAAHQWPASMKILDEVLRQVSSP